ncbi:MAG: hypothetical protein FWD93_01965, partial [Coriobacteriia bacterium]|nr:hypothetical protein [Coriobacteriia bacterium]
PQKLCKRNSPEEDQAVSSYKMAICQNALRNMLDFDFSNFNCFLQSLKGKFTTNTSRSFAIHGIVIALCLISIFIPVTIPVAAFIVASFVMYIYLGYRYLIWTSGKNTSALFVLAGFLAGIALLLHVFSMLSSSNHEIVFLVYNYFNYPAFAFMRIAVILLGFSLASFLILDYFAILAAFTSAFIPSLLMYFGLRLKARKVRKMQSKDILASKVCKTPHHWTDSSTL